MRYDTRLTVDAEEMPTQKLELHTNPLRNDDTAAQPQGENRLYTREQQGAVPSMPSQQDTASISMPWILGGVLLAMVAIALLIITMTRKSSDSMK